MAEIKIEKKKRVWPWFLLILITALVIVLLNVFQSKNGEKENENENEKATEIVDEFEKGKADNESIENTAEKDSIINTYVNDYVNFVENDNNKMTLDHAYTNSALKKLVVATEAMAEKNDLKISADLKKVHEYAEMITKDPLDTSHADSIRKATDILTNALQEIQKANYPELKNETDGLRAASESINPDVLTLNQKVAVKAFFEKAATLFKKMKLINSNSKI
ncbi:MAG: hypothetical protein JW798_12135 [Prolixibacteraceae bacterium]|nr:hypothetical protein [Prolixibacteraceae bacterium]